jgi:hypothetical protein
MSVSTGDHGPAGLRSTARNLLQDRIFDVIDDLGETFGLIMMAIHIDDYEVFVIAFYRLLPRMFQMARGIVIFGKCLGTAAGI